MEEGIDSRIAPEMRMFLLEEAVKKALPRGEILWKF